MSSDTKLQRFADLKERGVVTSWPQLARLIDNHGFPPGYLLSPGCRVWDPEVVDEWIDSRRAASGAQRQSSSQQRAG